MIFDNTFLPVGVSPLQPTRKNVLRLGDFQERSFVAGPGVRSVMWVAGCHRRCPGCMKPELFPFDAGRDIGIDEAFAMLMAVPGVDGVTFSGGEPFEQAAPLGLLAARLRLSGRDVTVYTGYRFEFLRDDASGQYAEFLNNVDLLIEGEYRANEADASRWRGSANQRLVPLSPTGGQLLKSTPGLEMPMAEVQIVVDGPKIRLTGCPTPGLLDEIMPHLAARGVTLRPIDPRGTE